MSILKLTIRLYTTVICTASPFRQLHFIHFTTVLPLTKGELEVAITHRIKGIFHCFFSPNEGELAIAERNAVIPLASILREDKHA